MSTRFIRPRGSLVLAFAASIISLLVLVPSASAAVTAHLRVLGPGTTLEPGTSYVTDTTSIQTDPGADCLGPGTGGSGQTVSVPGPTALGLVRDASGPRKALKPLSVSDSSGFGLAVCGIGGLVADANHFWLVRVNHEDITVGGDQQKVNKGDDVLWYLSEFNASATNPPDLELVAPARTEPDSFNVNVIEHGCTYSPPDFVPNCAAKPAKGVSVTGAATKTDAQGNASINADDEGTLKIQATRGGDIPSEALEVCVNADLEACPAKRGERIVGTSKADKIRGTKGADRIRSRGGNDVVRVRKGEADRVNCGPGHHDVAKIDDSDKARRCEKVRRH
jgi:hypothetical protein